MKADTTYVSNQLLTKADINDVYTKEEIPSIIQSNTANKTDKSYVDNNLALKADKSTTYTKTEVDSAIDVATSGIDTKLATKANASDVYTKTDTDEKISEAVSSKADTSYVNTQLALKADKSDTYTKKEIDEKLDNPTITGDTLPIGSVIEWTGTQTPQNWLLCDGREVSRTTYSELFAAIGTVWGAGDGSTSFNIPDYRDKFVLGAGGDVDLAETGGEKEVTLTIDQIPASAVSMSSTGGGQPHNNMPPYVGTYYIIKAKQSAGVVSTVVDTLSSTSTTDALSANMGKKLNDKGLKKLWENQSTKTNFLGKTINLLNNNYDYLVWFYYDDIQNSYSMSRQSLKGSGTVLNHSFSGSLTNLARTVNYQSDTSFNIQDCRTVTSNGVTVTNDKLIPIAIYGGKF